MAPFSICGGKLSDCFAAGRRGCGVSQSFLAVMRAEKYLEQTDSSKQGLFYSMPQMTRGVGQSRDDPTHRPPAPLIRGRWRLQSGGVGLASPSDAQAQALIQISIDPQVLLMLCAPRHAPTASAPKRHCATCRSLPSLPSYPAFRPLPSSPTVSCTDSEPARLGSPAPNPDRATKLLLQPSNTFRHQLILNPTPSLVTSHSLNLSPLRCEPHF